MDHTKKEVGLNLMELKKEVVKSNYRKDKIVDAYNHFPDKIVKEDNLNNKVVDSFYNLKEDSYKNHIFDYLDNKDLVLSYHIHHGNHEHLFLLYYIHNNDHRDGHHIDLFFLHDTSHDHHYD